MTATPAATADSHPTHSPRPRRRRRPRLGLRHHASAAALALATCTVLMFLFADPPHPLVFFAASICIAASRNRVRQLAGIHVALIAIALTLNL